MAKITNFMSPTNAKPVFCVLGAGHGGMAMAGHLAIMGYEVRLYNRSPQRIEPVKVRGGISVTGEVDGFGEIHLATTDIQEAIEGADVLMIVVPAYAHASIAEKSAPYLQDGQIIILNPGRTGGALEFRRVLNDKDVKAEVFVGETQTFIYASRATGPAQAQIFAIKNAIPLATIRAHFIPDALQVLKEAFPQFVPGDNVFKTSFDNIGAIFHPALAILNTAWIEDSKGNFDFYMQGASASAARILEGLDEERVNVAAALGIRAYTAREWLYLAYHAAGENLHDAMHANPGYRGIKAPDRLKHRYITEDVPMSLVPIASIGRMLGVSTPTIESIVHLACVLHHRDYWAEGRTIEKLGLAGLSVKEIRLLAVEGVLPESFATSPPSVIQAGDLTSPVSAGGATP